MLIQTFTQYLLEKGLITKPQVKEIMKTKAYTKPRLLYLAEEQGLMSKEDVAKYNSIATESDYFEDLAVYEGFVTQGQVFSLLKLQSRSDSIMIEVLSRTDIIPREKAVEHLQEFKMHYNLSEQDYLKIIDSDIRTCLEKLANVPLDTPFYEYVAQFVNQIMQNVDANLILNKSYTTEEETFSIFVGAKCAEKTDMIVGYCASRETLMQIAERYSKMTLYNFDDECQDALKELINVTAGVFVGVLERKYLLDYELMVPSFYAEKTLKNPQVLPLTTDFGAINVVFAQL